MPGGSQHQIYYCCEGGDGRRPLSRSCLSCLINLFRACLRNSSNSSLSSASSASSAALFLNEAAASAIAFLASWAIGWVGWAVMSHRTGRVVARSPRGNLLLPVVRPVLLSVR